MSSLLRGRLHLGQPRPRPTHDPGAPLAAPPIFLGGASDRKVVLSARCHFWSGLGWFGLDDCYGVPHGRIFELFNYLRQAFYEQPSDFPAAS